MTCELSLVFNIYFLGQRSGQPGSFKDIKPSDSSGKQPFSAQHWTPSPVVCRWVWGGKKEYFLYFCLGEENCIEEIFFFFCGWFSFCLFCYNEMSHLGSEGAGVKTSSLISGSWIFHEAVTRKQCSFESALDFYNVVN